MRLSYRLTVATVAALLFAGGLTGCSGDDSSSGAERAGGSASQNAEATPNAPAKGGEPSVADAGDPVAKGTFDSPIAPGAKVDIAIVSLRANGKLATLAAQVTPHVPPGADDKPTLYKLNGRADPDVSLIDPVNLKRYTVVKDSSRHELQTDTIITRLANEQPANFSFTFAAPPENVKTVDVQIGAWPTFRNVQVER